LLLIKIIRRLSLLEEMVTTILCASIVRCATVSSAVPYYCYGINLFSECIGRLCSFCSSSNTSTRRKNNSGMVLVQLVAVGTDTLVSLVEFLPLRRDVVPSLAGPASMWDICINSQYNFCISVLDASVSFLYGTCF
jgi:hypothetical protein